jgi:hypothetical protein
LTTLARPPGAAFAAREQKRAERQVMFSSSFCLAMFPPVFLQNATMIGCTELSTLKAGEGKRGSGPVPFAFRGKEPAIFLVRLSAGGHPDGTVFASWRIKIHNCLPS